MDNQILNQILEEIRSLNTKMEKLSDKIENVSAVNLLLAEIVRVEKKNENNHNEVINALESIQNRI
ncbi:hypothetical protein [Cytobacillus firmus]|uniref:hypothetical protein n=1 Tax=Cytobacillus firmus TaxID=1399 RepID=UPI001C9622C1|nr:hypothetical protein [Cytobacillus firmus]MBY6053970.1 hypothetical protein [Cytobacillus firmus]